MAYYKQTKSMASFVSPSWISATLLRPSCFFFFFTTSPTSVRVTVNSLLPIRLRSNTMTQPTSGIASLPSETTAAATPENTAGKDDVLVQYVVLRRDLIDNWPLGSVVTQGCHASVSAIWSYRDDPHTIQYCSPENIDSMHKVTLEVKGETELVNLSEKLKGGEIAHKLWIEQPENIPTCLATKPCPKSIVSPFFKKLKLCK